MKKKLIFLVDSDPVFLNSLEWNFAHGSDYYLESFHSGDAFIKSIIKNPDAVIIDYEARANQIMLLCGLDLLAEVKRQNQDIPIIMMLSLDKLEWAIKSMSYQAFGFVVKGETQFEQLKQNLVCIFKCQKMEAQLKWYMDRV